MFELTKKYPRWLWMSVVGSQNYGTATPESDTDVKVAYLPTFEEFYRNSFQHADTGSPDGDDYTLHPAHEFLRHAFKGNMNFWEAFFSTNLKVNFSFFEASGQVGAFFGNVRSVVLDSPMANFNAMRGMAVQKYYEAWKLVNGMDDDHRLYADDPRVWKSAQHSMRMLDTLLEYHRTGRLVLNLTDREAFPDTHVWEGWRDRNGTAGDLRFAEYVAMYEEKLATVDSLEDSFKAHDSNPDVRSNRERAQWFVDQTLMDLVRKHS